jgi:hypothetical protein
MKNRIKFKPICRVVVLSAVAVAIVALSFLGGAPRKVTAGFDSAEYTAPTRVSTADIVEIKIPAPARMGVWDEVVDVTEEKNLYSEDGRKLGYIPQIGLVVTSDGFPVYNQGDPTVDGDTPIVTHDPDTGEFSTFDTAGAEKKLEIWENSFLDRKYLRNDGKIVNAITGDLEVFMITFKPKGTNIYVTRRRHDNGWLVGLVSERYEWRYNDLNGREIKTKYIADFKPAPWWRYAVWAFATGIPGVGVLYSIGVFATEGYMVPFTKLLERYNLLELYIEITQLSVKKNMPVLVDGDSGNPITTPDGRVIYINPKNNQLCDFLGWGLYNSINGRPILLHDNEIITTDLAPQAVQNDVLLNSTSVRNLLEAGIPFYITTQTTQFGQFDVPAFLDGDGVFQLFGSAPAPAVEVIDNGHATGESTNGAGFTEVKNDVQRFFEHLGGSIIPSKNGNWYDKYIRLFSLVLIAAIIGVVGYFIWPVAKPAIDSAGSALTIATQPINDMAYRAKRKRKHGKWRR